jgi:lipopolysaccharide/colanic/teichoic acid biosynthesis glycosyltransferase
MKVNAPDIRNQDGSTFNAETDPRLTKIGRFLRKTSLDETPQLLNVLKGDMSMVGPRPDLPEQRVLYEGNEDRKLEAKPGLTGYNQAYYRNAIPWKERIQNDIYYIDHMSFLFDFKILLRTIMAVFRRKGVFLASENAFQISDADAELANEGQGRG